MSLHHPIAPIGLLLHDVSRGLRRRFDELARRHHMTLPQWRTISQLARADGLSQVALASLIEANPMTVSGIVDRLEAKGLVERVADPGDSRAKLVQITPKARALVTEVRAIGLELYEEVLDGVSDADQEALVRALTKIRDSLNAQRTPRKDSLK
jgi:MarR family transcriptional regulator, transcriptional regulator for hemolysin